MDCEFEWISLDRIDTSNVRFRITTPQDKPDIRDSIARIGLTCPVTVKEEDGRLIVVSGFRRVAACRRLQWASVLCRILPAATAATVCAEIAIADNLTQRALNVVEQARCHQLLSAACGDRSSARRIADALGLRCNKDLEAKLTTVLSAPECVQIGLVKGAVSLPVALSLAKMAPSDAEALAAFFDTLPMGLNKQREIISFLNEIAAREDIALQALLSENEIKKVMADDLLDGNQKARLIRAYLRKRRYPRLTAVERGVVRCINALSLGRAIQITPPPGFEGRTCTMTIRFDDLQELKQAHQKIGEIIEHPMTPCLFENL